VNNPEVWLRRLALFVFDFVIIFFIWWIAYSFVSFGGENYGLQRSLLAPYMTIIFLIPMVVFRLYPADFRFVSSGELIRFFYAFVCSSLCLIIFNAFIESRETFLHLPLANFNNQAHVLRIPYSVVAIFISFSFIATAAARFLPRVLSEKKVSSEASDNPTLLIGSAEASALMIRQLRQGDSSIGQAGGEKLSFKPVCAVTFEKEMVDQNLLGVPCKVGIESLQECIEKYEPKTILLSRDGSTPDALQKVVDECKNKDIRLLTIPSLSDIASDKVDIRSVRNVDLEDLLGRPTNLPEIPADKEYIKGKSILVTGAGGTIGSELVRQIIAFNPSKIVLMGRGENSIHELVTALENPDGVTLLPVIVDIQNRRGLERVFEVHKPHVIFHAAAHKHVNLMEGQPLEALSNNVLGTAFLAQLALEYDVERFVLISSDKAVRSTNVMGASKRLAEEVLYAYSKTKNDICFIAVRFGNVLGSRGSVIRVFERQLEKKRELTITDPDATRFFMTVREAVGLVLRAGAESGSGALYHLDMGQPVKIGQLVENFLTLSNISEDERPEIKIIGLRPGEKKEEEVLTAQENATATPVEKLWKAQPQHILSQKELESFLRCLNLLVTKGDNALAIRFLMEMAPGYQPSDQIKPAETLDLVKFFDQLDREAELQESLQRTNSEIAEEIDAETTSELAPKEILEEETDDEIFEDDEKYIPQTIDIGNESQELNALNDFEDAEESAFDDESIEEHQIEEPVIEDLAVNESEAEESQEEEISESPEPDELIEAEVKAEATSPTQLPDEVEPVIEEVSEAEHEHDYETPDLFGNDEQSEDDSIEGEHEEPEPEQNIEEDSDENAESGDLLTEDEPDLEEDDLSEESDYEHVSDEGDEESSFDPSEVQDEKSGTAYDLSNEPIDESLNPVDTESDITSGLEAENISGDEDSAATDEGEHEYEDSPSDSVDETESSDDSNSEPDMQLDATESEDKVESEDLPEQYDLFSESSDSEEQDAEDDNSFEENVENEPESKPLVLEELQESEELSQEALTSEPSVDDDSLQQSGVELSEIGDDSEDAESSDQDEEEQTLSESESNVEVAVPTDSKPENPENFEDYEFMEAPAQSVCVFFAILDEVSPEDRKNIFQHLATRMGDDAQLIISGVPDVDVVPESIRSRTTIIGDENKLITEKYNAAIKAAPENALLVTIGPGIHLNMDFCDRVTAYANDHRDSFVFYPNYIESKNGKEETVELHEHNGCPHERFDFGEMVIYRTMAVKEVGYFDTSLHHAWEYDIHLKLMEIGLIKSIPEVLYKFVIIEEEDSKSGALHSPGRGKLGGFSYVFYPEDVEKEVTSVFEKGLKRIGAWLENETDEVPQPAEKPPVLASIVIPVLNRVKYIGNAIKKVQEGTFPDFEIVVVDNGSTDGTYELVEKITQEDNRIRLYKGTGGTIASALNHAIRESKGKYICQLDSDDEYAPTTLEKMIGHLESHPKCGLCISYYRLMNEQGVIIEDVDPITHSGYSRNQILRRDGGGAVRIFPKAVLEEFGLYDEEHYGNFGEDYDMVLKTGEKYDVDRVHEVLYHYRRHSDNTDVIRDPAMKYNNKNRARQEALRRRMAINEKLGSNK